MSVRVLSRDSCLAASEETLQVTFCPPADQGVEPPVISCCNGHACGQASEGAATWQDLLSMAALALYGNHQPTPAGLLPLSSLLAADVDEMHT